MKHGTPTRATGVNRERSRKSNGARSGGKTGRLHVRSVWGKPDPQGRQARSKESLVLFPLPAY